MKGYTMIALPLKKGDKRDEKILKAIARFQKKNKIRTVAETIRRMIEG